MGTNIEQASAQGVVKLQANSDRVQKVKLGFNKALVVELPSDAYDILVADPSVADAVTRTSRRIYLFGKQIGQTNVFVFGPNGEQIVSMDIVIERDVAGLEEHLKRFIKDSDIKVELVNDNVVLEGIVQTPLDATRAVQLAQAFVTGGEATTGNLALTASGSDGGDVAISNPGGLRSSSIINLLQIVGQDQVTLKVTVAEVSRTVMKQLGVDLLASGSSNGINYGITSDTFAGLGKYLSDSGGSLIYSQGATSIEAFVNAMESAGVMRTLAEPSLTAISGEQATFRVGGEFNVFSGSNTTPANSTVVDGQVVFTNGPQTTNTFQQIEYGIGLEFLPVVLSPGRISLKVRTTVSEPTAEGAYSTSNGVGNVLSIRRRLADTTVELPSGGSMMIAGLIRDEFRTVSSGLPGLSRLPVLGTLFRSKDFIRNETELVIIVTPLLVRPVARNQLARPDDNLVPASDGSQFILNKVNRVYGTAQTDKPAGRYHGVPGFIFK